MAVGCDQSLDHGKDSPKCIGQELNHRMFTITNNDSSNLNKMLNINVMVIEIFKTNL